MIQTKTAHKRSVARLSAVRQPGYLKKEPSLERQKPNWEHGLERLQKKLRKCAGQRSVTDELIKDRRNEA